MLELAYLACVDTVHRVSSVNHALRKNFPQLEHLQLLLHALGFFVTLVNIVVCRSFTAAAHDLMPTIGASVWAAVIGIVALAWFAHAFAGAFVVVIIDIVFELFLLEKCEKAFLNDHVRLVIRLNHLYHCLKVWQRTKKVLFTLSSQIFSRQFVL